MKFEALSATDPQACCTAFEALAARGFRPSLAFVFLSSDQDPGPIQEYCRRRDIVLCGASTAGEISNRRATEGQISCLLIEMGRDAFELFFEPDISEHAEAKAEAIGNAAGQLAGEVHFIVLCSGLSTDGDAILNGLSRGAPRAVELAGGMAGDDLKLEQTLVFTSGAKSTQGLCVLALDGRKVRVRSLAASGWQAVGVSKTITRSEGNRVFSIDGEPVLDVYQKYFGIEEVHLPKQAVEIGIHYPLQILREGRNPLLRAPLAACRADRSMTFGGSVPEGSQVKLSIPAGAHITDSLLESYGILKQEEPEANAVLVFSCIGRSYALGPLIQDEVAQIYSLWKAPTCGFFTYGELGHAAGEPCQFYNETCVVALLQEVVQ